MSKDREETSATSAEPAQKKQRKMTVAQYRESVNAPDQLRSFTGSYISGMVESLRATGVEPSAVTLAEAGDLAIGLPAPSLSWEYLTQLNVFPLGYVIQIVGTKKCMKSGLCFEIARWFRKACGVSLLLEHESKLSPDWAASIIGWDDPNALATIFCNSIDAWQRWLFRMVDEVKAAMSGTAVQPGPGKTWPYLLFVDSLVGKSMEETQTKIVQRGSAGRAFPLAALSISEFLKVLPQRISDWPISVMMVNHLKPSTDERGRRVRHKSGGASIEFQQAFEFEMSRQPSTKIGTTKEDGRKLRLQLVENALGIDGRSIPIEVRWHEERLPAEDGRLAWRQVTTWEWHHSTAVLLANITALDESKSKRVKEITNVQIHKGRFSCTSMGISPKSPVTGAEFGQALYEQCPEILNELRCVFGVKMCKVFQPGVDYDKQRQRVKQEHKAKAAKPRKDADG